MVHADRSILQTWNYLKQQELQGLITSWPRPTAIAWKIIACYAIFEAAFQLLLPGKAVQGPISAAGNQPTYKANGLQAHWFRIFNPAIVYEHLGEIFSAFIFGSFFFCVPLYIKGHVAPSSADSGYSGNIIIDFYWIWDDVLGSSCIDLFHKAEFFWREAGYWNSMDIAHDRGGVYTPEILSAFLWTVPAIFKHFLPYFYVVFLPILLIDRAKTDDNRCQSKYGKYCKLYCQKVPYRIVPGIY